MPPGRSRKKRPQLGDFDGVLRNSNKAIEINPKLAVA
jgi:hypothetical protein